MYSTLTEARKYTEPQVFRNVLKNAEIAAKDYKSKEIELIKALQEVDAIRAYRLVGFNSLFQYATKALGLSESQAYTLITVARKSKELPALQKALESQEITVSKARRLSAVISAQNQMQWIDKAKRCSKQELEKAVAKENPRTLVPEKSRYLTDTLMALQLPIEEDTYKKLERVRELLSQSKHKPVNLEEAIQHLCDFYIEKKDPLEKAKRILKKKKAYMVSAQNQKTVEVGVHGKRLIEASAQGQRLIEANSQKQNANLNSNENKSRTKQVHRKTTNPQISKTNTPKDQLGPGRVQPLSIQRKARKPIPAEVQKLSIQRKARKPIPAEALHQVRVRDQQKCQWQLANNQICGQKKWLHIHHIKPISLGGKHQLENLVTLCSNHHRIVHEKVQLGPGRVQPLS